MTIRKQKLFKETAQNIEDKNDKLTFTKIKNFCCSENIKKMKSQVTD